MSYAGRAASHYLQTQVKSSSPLELVVLLYDGAIRSLATAIDAMARKDIPARRDAMSKTFGFIGELQGTLDMEQGGSIAAELDRLYTWMTERMVEATVRQEAAPLVEVRRVLEILRDGWNQIAKRAPGSAA